MALAFATTARVNCGSDASLDDLTTLSYLGWIYRTGSGNARVWTKGSATEEQKRVRLNDAGAGDFSIWVNRATTSLEARSNTGVIVANTWTCIAGQFDTAGADGDQKLFHGDLTTKLTELGAYGRQRVGSGAVQSEAAGDFLIGNRVDGSFDAPMGGRIGFIFVFNTILTLGQLQEQQFHPHNLSSSVGSWILHGTGVQPDLSGTGNNGTVTDATVVAHVPLGPPFGFDIGFMDILVPVGGLSIPVAMNSYRRLRTPV